MAQSNPLISHQTKDTLGDMLRETAKTPKPPTLAQLLSRAKPSLRKMLKNGHSYEDIAVLFRARGVETTSETIEALHGSGRRKKGQKGKSKDPPAAADLLIPPAAAEAILRDLAQQADIRRGFTKQELVAEIGPEIAAAIAAGYSYDDIAARMTENGLSITGSTLRKYHQVSKRPDKNPADPGRPRQSPENQPEPAPPPDRRLPVPSYSHDADLAEEFNI